MSNDKITVVEKTLGVNYNKLLLNLRRKLATITDSNPAWHPGKEVESQVYDSSYLNIIYHVEGLTDKEYANQQE